jgi:hypothetical protein
VPDASGKLFVGTEALGDANLRENKETQLKGLILAQNERWRRGLGMQVEREPARGTAANGVVTGRQRTLRMGIATGNCG